MNTRIGRLGILGLAAAFGLCAAGMAAATGAAPEFRAPPDKIVIVSVDLEAVSSQLKEREDKEKALGAKKDENEKHLKDVIEQLKQEEDKVKSMPDTPDKIVAAKAFREHGMRAKWEKEYNDQLLTETSGEMLNELFRKISSAVQTIAKRQGYHIVISSDEKVNVGGGDPNQIRQAIALKRFLYIAPELDITQDVIREMNNDYALGGGKPAAGGVAPAPAPAPGTSTPPKRP